MVPWSQSLGGVVVLIHKILVSSDVHVLSLSEKKVCREIVLGRVVRVTLTNEAMLFCEYICAQFWFKLCPDG